MNKYLTVLISCCITFAHNTHAGPVRQLLDFSDSPVEIGHLSIAEPYGRIDFSADLDTPGQLEIYSIPLDGSLPPAKLSGTETLYGLRRVELSPDGTSMIYHAAPQSVGKYNLYYVPRDGSTPSVQLNQPLESDQNLFVSVPDSDGSHAVYSIISSSTGQTLYSVPVNNPENRVTLLGLDPKRYSLINPFDTVLFIAEAESFEYFLGVVPMDASTSYKNLGDANEDSLFTYIDSRQLAAYVYNNDIYTVPVDDSLNPSLLAEIQSAGGNNVYRISESPDGDYLLYRASFITNGTATYDVYSVPLDGSLQPVELSPQGITEFFIRSSDMTVNPANSRVAFVVPGANAGELELHTANIDGSGVSSPVFGPFPEDSTYSITLRNELVDDAIVRIGDQNGSNYLSLIDFQGESDSRLITNIVPDGFIIQTPVVTLFDGKRLLFYVIRDTSTNLYSLWLVPDLDNPQQLPLASLLPDGNKIRRITYFQDSDTIIYIAGPSTDEITGVYIIDLTLLAAQSTLQPPAISFNGSDIVITWDAMAEVSLQSCDDLASGTWTDVPDTEGQGSHTVQPDGAQTFYRLVYREQEL